MLDRALGAYDETQSAQRLDTDTVLGRVWRAQHFSYWMTSMLHRFPDASPFDLRRRLAELEAVTSSAAGSTFLAENYTGLPLG